MKLYLFSDGRFAYTLFSCFCRGCILDNRFVESAVLLECGWYSIF